MSKKTVLPVSLTEDQYNYIKLISIHTGESMAKIIRGLINKDIKANNNEGNL